MSTDSKAVSLQVTLQEKVSQRMRDTFLDLIPKEQFDQMVNVGLDEFMNGPRSARFRTDKVWEEGKYVEKEVPRTYPEGKQYDPAQDTNTLPGMIMAAIKEKGKSELQKIMNEPGFLQIWDNGRNVASDLIMKAISENTDMFVQDLFGNLIMGTMMRLRQEMMNNPSFMPRY